MSTCWEKSFLKTSPVVLQEKKAHGGRVRPSTASARRSVGGMANRGLSYLSTASRLSSDQILANKHRSELVSHPRPPSKARPQSAQTSRSSLMKKRITSPPNECQQTYFKGDSGQPSQPPMPTTRWAFAGVSRVRPASAAVGRSRDVQSRNSSQQARLSQSKRRPVSGRRATKTDTFEVDVGFDEYYTKRGQCLERPVSARFMSTVRSRERPQTAAAMEPRLNLKEEVSQKYWMAANTGGPIVRNPYPTHDHVTSAVDNLYSTGRTLSTPPQVIPTDPRDTAFDFAAGVRASCERLAAHTHQFKQPSLHVDAHAKTISVRKCDILTGTSSKVNLDISRIPELDESLLLVEQYTQRLQSISRAQEDNEMIRDDSIHMFQTLALSDMLDDLVQSTLLRAHEKQALLRVLSHLHDSMFTAMPLPITGYDLRSVYDSDSESDTDSDLCSHVNTNPDSDAYFGIGMRAGVAADPPTAGYLALEKSTSPEISQPRLLVPYHHLLRHLNEYSEFIRTDIVAQERCHVTAQVTLQRFNEHKLRNLTSLAFRAWRSYTKDQRQHQVIRKLAAKRRREHILRTHTVAQRHLLQTVFFQWRVWAQTNKEVRRAEEQVDYLRSTASNARDELLILEQSSSGLSDHITALEQQLKSLSLSEQETGDAIYLSTHAREQCEVIIGGAVRSITQQLELFRTLCANQRPYHRIWDWPRQVGATLTRSIDNKLETTSREQWHANLREAFATTLNELTAQEDDYERRQFSKFFDPSEGAEGVQRFLLHWAEYQMRDVNLSAAPQTKQNRSRSPWRRLSIAVAFTGKRRKSSLKSPGSAKSPTSHLQRGPRERSRSLSPRALESSTCVSPKSDSARHRGSSGSPNRHRSSARRRSSVAHKRRPSSRRASAVMAVDVTPNTDHASKKPEPPKIVSLREDLKDGILYCHLLGSLYGDDFPQSTLLSIVDPLHRVDQLLRHLEEKFPCAFHAGSHNDSFRRFVQGSPQFHLRLLSSLFLLQPVATDSTAELCRSLDTQLRAFQRRWGVMINRSQIKLYEFTKYQLELQDVLLSLQTLQQRVLRRSFHTKTVQSRVAALHSHLCTHFLSNEQAQYFAVSGRTAGENAVACNIRHNSRLASLIAAFWGHDKSTTSQLERLQVLFDAYSMELWKIYAFYCCQNYIGDAVSQLPEQRPDMLRDSLRRESTSSRRGSTRSSADASPRRHSIKSHRGSLVGRMPSVLQKEVSFASNPLRVEKTNHTADSESNLCMNGDDFESMMQDVLAGSAALKTLTTAKALKQIFHLCRCPEAILKDLSLAPPTKKQLAKGIPYNVTVTSTKSLQRSAINATLEWDRFSEAIMRLCLIKGYTEGASSDGLSPSDVIAQALPQVLSACQQPEIFALRKQLHTAEGRTVLAEFQAPLQSAFKLYMELYPCEDWQRCRLGVVAFTEMMKDAAILTSRVTLEQIQSIFRAVYHSAGGKLVTFNREEAVTVVLGTFDCSDTPSAGIDFTQFLEALIALALCALPSPFVTPLSSTQQFLSRVLIPNLRRSPYAKQMQLG